jgi:hypothetical protein
MWNQDHKTEIGDQTQISVLWSCVQMTSHMTSLGQKSRGASQLVKWVQWWFDETIVTISSVFQIVLWSKSRYFTKSKCGLMSYCCGDTEAVICNRKSMGWTLWPDLSGSSVNGITCSDTYLIDKNKEQTKTSADFIIVKNNQKKDNWKDRSRKNRSLVYKRVLTVDSVCTRTCGKLN